MTVAGAAAAAPSQPGRRVTPAKALAWAGYAVFGLPPLLAIPALAATSARFGVWATATQAAPVAAITALPLLLWLRYTRRRPTTRWAKLVWLLVAAAAVLTIGLSPIFFWAGPMLVVIGAEMLRLLLGPPASRVTSRIRRRRALLTSRSVARTRR